MKQFLHLLPPGVGQGEASKLEQQLPEFQVRPGGEGRVTLPGPGGRAVRRARGGDGGGGPRHPGDHSGEHGAQGSFLLLVKCPS